MLLRELLAAIEALGLTPDTEVVLQTPRDGCYNNFELVLCDYEHEEGGVINGPDDGNWGGPEHNPRPLPHPILSLEALCLENRTPIMF